MLTLSGLFYLTLSGPPFTSATDLPISLLICQQVCCCLPLLLVCTLVSTLPVVKWQLLIRQSRSYCVPSIEHVVCKFSTCMYMLYNPEHLCCTMFDSLVCLQALRSSNVKVVLINPGPIATAMTEVRKHNTESGAHLAILLAVSSCRSPNAS